MKKLGNGRIYRTAEEVEEIRSYFKRPHHTIYLKTGQTIEMDFDTSNINDKQSDKIIYWEYRDTGIHWYADNDDDNTWVLNVKMVVPKSDIITIKYF